MKVRIGAVQHRVDTAQRARLDAVQTDIAAAIVKAAVAESVEISPRYLKTLERRLAAAAREEAAKIFDVILGIIDQPRFGGAGVSQADVKRGAPRGPLNPSAPAIRWPALTLNYQRQKARRYPANKYRMFRRTNALRRYLSSRGGNFVQSRLGGIVVRSDTQAPRGALTRQYRGEAVWRQTVLQEELPDRVIGRVSVTIFPKLSPSLAPGLATRRWTRVDPNRGFERVYFRGAKAAEKLMNREQSFRPLVSPVTQYFVLARIPNAINQSLKGYLRRTDIGRQG